MERMRTDVTLYIHGYNTCAVECAHGERTVHTSKRVEYWSSWEGKCRLVQLLHNHRTRETGESLLQQLGWQVADGVSTHLSRIDRDKAKHHQLKTAAKYNARQKALRLEKKERAATDSEHRAGRGAEAKGAREAAALLQREEAAAVRGEGDEERRGSSTGGADGSRCPCSRCSEDEEGTTKEGCAACRYRQGERRSREREESESGG